MRERFLQVLIRIPINPCASAKPTFLERGYGLWMNARVFIRMRIRGLVSGVDEPQALDPRLDKPALGRDEHARVRRVMPPLHHGEHDGRVPQQG